MNAQPSTSQPTSLPEMSLPEWLVLAILSQQPAHGFAVAQLTASGGELGRVWQIPKAVVYRAIGRLLEAGLIVPEGTEPGLGPQRTVYAASDEGRGAAARWLHEPVGHVREIRSVLLLKLALLDRTDEEPADLLAAQRAVLEPLVDAIESRRSGSQGFDATLLAWRRATAVAALEFIDIITRAHEPAELADEAVHHLLPPMPAALIHCRLNCGGNLPVESAEPCRVADRQYHRPLRECHS